MTGVTESAITGITYYEGEKGDEVSDYTHNTKLGVRASIKSTSIFFYGTAGELRASAANSLTDAMFKSESFNGSVTEVDETKITGITYYEGEKGDEVSDYTHNTKLGQRDTVKSTSIFFYGTSGTLRASQANPLTDAMFKSESFNGSVTEVDDTKITGITYYEGDKGDEVSDYTHNTKLGVRASIKSTSIFFYGTPESSEPLRPTPLPMPCSSRNPSTALLQR